MLLSLNAQALGLHVRTDQEDQFILNIPKMSVGVWDKKVYNGVLAYDIFLTPSYANELPNGGS